jgi:hypothetical protein
VVAESLCPDKTNSKFRPDSVVLETSVAIGGRGKFRSKSENYYVPCLPGTARHSLFASWDP